MRVVSLTRVQADMPKTTNKTKATGADVDAFIAAIGNETRQSDARILVDLFTEATGEVPALWGPTIIGFGRYHYIYESGREGEMCRAGFSPRKANLVLYLISGYESADVSEEMAALRARLGKHKVGKSCLYINRLADIDQDVLRAMIAVNVRYMEEKYPR
jgi:Domain of unknown function (DU1801)